MRIDDTPFFGTESLFGDTPFEDHCFKLKVENCPDYQGLNGSLTML
jgi:hypothetical protein